MAASAEHAFKEASDSGSLLGGISNQCREQVEMLWSYLKQP